MSDRTGTLRLARLALRRDRVQLPVWLGVLTASHVASAASTVALYSTEAERIEIARTSAASAAALAFNGLISGTSEGALAASQTLLLMLTSAALMSTFAVVRHTRRDEETGRAELLGATVTGRRAPLYAALAVAAAANVALGALNAAALVAIGFPLAGSVATGTAITTVGIAFASIAAVTAQLSSSARTANSLAGAAIGAAFALRTIGDMTGHTTEGGVKVVSGWASWLSPIGWGQQIRPFHDDEWSVLVLPVVLTVVMVGAAFALRARRDLGAGLFPDRRGRAAASPRLLSSLGLAWRVQRGVIAGWAVAIAILGAGFGAIANEVEDLVGDGEETREIIEQWAGAIGALTDVYLAATLAMGALGVGAYAVQALLRMRSEETAGTLEAVLATRVSRGRWLASHVVIVFGGTVVLLALTGATAGLTHGLIVGEASHQTARLTGAALMHTPAVLALGGLTVALFGLVPSVSRAVAWSVYGAFALLLQLGELLDLPAVILDLSPFGHIPAVPAVDARVAPLVVLGIVSAVLGATGLVAFRRRDLAT